MRKFHFLTTLPACLIILAAVMLCCGDVCAETTTVKSAVPGKDYLIGAGDVLGIEVWKDPNLTRSVVVLPDGKIVFPLIGEVIAAGRSVESLKKEIMERINIYVPDSVLTLEVRQINAQYIYVLGRVNSPGRPQISGSINVLQALAMAGGLNPFAKRSDIRIFRQEGGQTRIIRFNYDDVTNGDRLDDNIELKQGDVLFVP